MKLAFNFKINFTGGIISPGYLLHLLEALEKANINNVRFGLRQQMLIDVAHKDYQKVVASLNAQKIEFEINKDEYPNIQSSYSAEEIFNRDTWVSEGVFKDIFDLFDYKPKLKINISNNNQTFNPFFTGNINWIASKNNHFWYLFIRFPKTGIIVQWKDLIYTNDIPRLSKYIEKEIFEQAEYYFNNNKANSAELYNMAAIDLKIISRPAEDQFILPEFKLPYYEGFNSYGNKLWLGIYKRNELFTIPFLKDICNICLQTKIGQLYATPWKSLIIKNIEENHRIIWDKVLSKHRINVRHASNELNWQVEDTTEEGLCLKRLIIRQFDKEDVRTFGLCFAIKTRPRSGVFGSIIIKKQYNLIRNSLKPLSKFDILYTADFNPNSRKYILFRSGVSKEHISTYLISLCKYYYEQLSNKDSGTGIMDNDEQSSEHKTFTMKMVYQCRHCLTVYDEEIGEPDNQISPGTLFNQLSSDYCCPLCNSIKEDFVRIEKALLTI